MMLRFLKDENGATAIEYGLIAALIAVAMIGGVFATGRRAPDQLWGDNNGEIQKGLNP